MQVRGSGQATAGFRLIELLVLIWINPASWRALATRAGHEPIPADAY
jgi:hypothetical protein